MTDTNQNSDINQIEKDEISLIELVHKIKDWISYLKTQWKIIIGVTIFGAVIGFTYASFQKPLFIATTTFVLEEDKNGGGINGAMGLVSSIGVDLNGGGLFSNSNIFELMKSRLVLEKTLLNSVQISGKQVSLAELYIETIQLKKGESKNLALLDTMYYSRNKNETYFRNFKDSILRILVTRLRPKIEIVKDKKSSINILTVRTENEIFSKLFCEQLLKQTSDFYIETKSKKARLNVEILQHQVDSIRSELNSAITSVAVASDNVYNLNPAFNVKKTPSTKKQIDVQANTAILNQLIGQLELSKVSLRKETPLVQIIDGPVFPLEFEKIGRIKSLIFFGFLSCFLTIIFLVLLRIYKKFVLQLNSNR